MEHLKLQCGGRPRWLAASTHPGEEAKVARVHKNLQATHEGMLTVIAPRHPNRSAEIEKELTQSGLKCAVRSRAEKITPQTDVYLADTLGELGLLYRLCPVVFMGGSLEPVGGHNLLEPAQIGCAVVSGNKTHNFAWIYRYFVRNSGVVVVENEQELSTQIDALLSDHNQVEVLASKAKNLVKSGQGALKATRNAIAEYLPLCKMADKGTKQ